MRFTGKNLNIFGFFGTKQTSSYGFVAAFGSAEAAARKLGRGFVWEIDAPGGIDVEATLGAAQSSLTIGEVKSLFPGGVANRFMKGAWKGHGGAVEYQKWYPNPDYATTSKGSVVSGQQVPAVAGVAADGGGGSAVSLERQFDELLLGIDQEVLQSPLVQAFVPFLRKASSQPLPVAGDRPPQVPLTVPMAVSFAKSLGDVVPGRPLTALSYQWVQKLVEAVSKAAQATWPHVGELSAEDREEFLGTVDKVREVLPQLDPVRAAEDVVAAAEDAMAVDEDAMAVDSATGPAGSGTRHRNTVVVEVEDPHALRWSDPHVPLPALDVVLAKGPGVEMRLGSGRFSQGDDGQELFVAKFVFEVGGVDEGERRRRAVVVMAAREALRASDGEPWPFGLDWALVGADGWTVTDAGRMVTVQPVAGGVSDSRAYVQLMLGGPADGLGMFRELLSEDGLREAVQRVPAVQAFVTFLEMVSGGGLPDAVGGARPPLPRSEVQTIAGRLGKFALGTALTSGSYEELRRLVVDVSAAVRQYLRNEDRARVFGIVGGAESALHELVPSRPEATTGYAPGAVRPTRFTDIAPQPIVMSQKRLFFVAATIDPDEAFVRGLSSAGEGLNIVTRVESKTHRRFRFMGAFDSAEEAARQLSQGFVFEIDAPGGVDVKATYARHGYSGLRADAVKALFPGGVANRFIKGSWVIRNGAIEDQKWKPNWDYAKEINGSAVSGRQAPTGAVPAADGDGSSAVPSGSAPDGATTSHEAFVQESDAEESGGWGPAERDPDPAYRNAIVPEAEDPHVLNAGPGAPESGPDQTLDPGPVQHESSESPTGTPDPAAPLFGGWAPGWAGPGAGDAGTPTAPPERRSSDAMLQDGLRGLRVNSVVDRRPSVLPPVKEVSQPQSAAVPQEAALEGWGMPVALARRFQYMAATNGVVIDVRGRSVEAVRRLAEGALPKPEAVKAKTINYYDAYLGVSYGAAIERHPGRGGLVGYFEPGRPANLPDDAKTVAAIHKRYEQRLQEYSELREAMKALTDTDEYRVVDGLVQRRNEEGEFRFLASDVDTWDMFDVQTGLRISDERQRAIIAKMMASDMDVMHEAHKFWQPVGEFAQQIFQTIVEFHQPGGEPLLRFVPKQGLTVAYDEPKIDPSLFAQDRDQDQDAASSGRSSVSENARPDGDAAGDGHAGQAPLTEGAGAPGAPAPKIVVTAPDEPGDRTPWYLEYGAMGQAVVPDSVKQIEFTDEQAELWAAAISDGLKLPESVPDPEGALRAGIRDAVQELLLTTEPKHWDNLLAAGRTLVVAGRLVWLRPVLRDLTFLPSEKKDVAEYAVGFTSTQTGGGSVRETVQGADTVVFTSVNLGAGAAASAALAGAPQFRVESSKTKEQSWARTVLFGRKPFVNEFNRFSAGLEMRVFVGGKEATPHGHRVTVPDRIHVDLPTPYSAENGHRPDPVAPQGPRPQQPRKHGPSQARDMLNAVDMTPVIAGLHSSLLDAGLPAPAVKKFMDGLEMDSTKGFLTEPTARSRYLWWASGDTSNSVEVSGPLLRSKFKGHVRLQASIASLQYVGDTTVGSREDIGAGTNRTASSKGASVGGLGGGYNTAGIGSGADAAAAGSDPENGHGASHPASTTVRVTGIAPAVGGSLTSERGTGYALEAGHLSHAVLNIFGDQSRYRVGLRLTATVESPTHTVKPVEVTTESELSVPQREAADFVNRTVGAGWTPDLRPIEEGPDAPRHQVLTPPEPHTVRRLPTARSPFNFGLLEDSRKGMRLNPHPREPLALASRQGFGFSMPIAFAGAEILQADIRAAIAQHHQNAVGARKAKKTDWATADRDLAAFYGESGLADPHKALLGVHESIELGGLRYKVSARLRWGDRIDGPNPLAGPADPAKDPVEQTYKMKVNARAVRGATVSGERSRGTTGKFGFGGGARVAVPEHEFHLGGLHFTTPSFRLALGAFKGLFGGSWKKAQKFSGLAKNYRRTETAGEVHEDRYWMMYEWTVTPASGKPSYLSGRVPVVGRVVTPLEHAPKQPVTPRQAETAGKARISKNRPQTDRPLDFATGTQGIYPAFLMMPELAQLAAQLYAEEHDLPDSWLRDPSQWPEEILDLAHPVILGSGFGAMTAAHGHESELPKTGKYKEAFRVKLLTDAPEDLGPSSEVEVEHYLQAAAAYEKEKSRELELGLSGSGGPQFRFGADREEGHHHSGIGGRVTVLGYGEAAAEWGHSDADKAGRIDITRATYGGDVHTVRTNPVFELTYVRWRGKELTETKRYLSKENGLDLLVPERRLADVMPPTPESDSQSEARSASEPETVPAAEPEAQPMTESGSELGSEPGTQAQPEQTGDADQDLAPTSIPDIVVTPPADEDPKLTRTYLSPDLIAGVGHPEVLRADGVLEAIFQRLRDHGVVTTEKVAGAAPRPNLLNRTLTASFSSEALEPEMLALTTNQGVSRWLPIPGALGSTRYLWVKVNATRLGPATDQRPRDDVKLTLRGEAEHEKAESESHGLEYGGGLDARARVEGGGRHGGVEGGAGYRSSRGRTEESTDKTVKIYRANPKDTSEEFNHDITFQVEMGTTTEPPEILSVPARAVDKIARLYSGEPSRDRGVFQWYDAGDGTEGNSPLVEGGKARLLVPRHMTVETHEPPQAIDLTRVRETAVAWESAPPRKPNKLKRRNQPQQPATKPDAPTRPPLPKELVEGLHPWSVPAAASIERWAGLTALRQRTAPELDVSAPPRIGGLNFTTRAGLRYNHFTSGNMLRSHIKELLNHAYQVPVGSDQVTVGLELDSAEILGPVEGTLLKQRSYEQRNEEPKSETERASGWDITLGPETGGSIGEHKVFDRLPITVKNWLNSFKRSSAMGETDERNKEAQRPYRQYRFGVTAVVHGPHGVIRIKVPAGLYGGLPVDTATGKLADGLEDVLGGLLAPRAKLALPQVVPAGSGADTGSGTVGHEAAAGMDAADTRQELTDARSWPTQDAEDNASLELFSGAAAPEQVAEARTFPPGLTHTHAPAAVVTHSMTELPEVAASDAAPQHGTVAPAARLPERADQASAPPDE
ncbi:hypothetical protein AB0N07_48600, partial [Streptomyces sp. NPDC051172]